jgi:formyltetrahydrofolate hydrolase
MSIMKSTVTLLFSCPDQLGLVAKIANFVYANGGNIILPTIIPIPMQAYF